MRELQLILIFVWLLFVVKRWNFEKIFSSDLWLMRFLMWQYNIVIDLFIAGKMETLISQYLQLISFQGAGATHFGNACNGNSKIMMDLHSLYFRIFAKHYVFKVSELYVKITINMAILVTHWVPISYQHTPPPLRIPAE